MQQRAQPLILHRLQVCAPSNSALDEIVHRLVTLGLTDQEGHVFTPNVVRVGVNIHHSVQSVALDTLVQHRLGRESSSKVRRCTVGLWPERTLASYGQQAVQSGVAHRASLSCRAAT